MTNALQVATDSVRTPPHDLRAERAVLGLCLAHPELMDAISLDPTEFYRPAHEWLWQQLTRLHADGEPITATTVNTVLMQHPKDYGRHGGAPYLFELFELAGDEQPVAASFLASVVRDHAQRRRISELGQRLTQLAQTGDDLGQVLGDAMDELETATREQMFGTADPIKASAPNRSWQPVDLGPVLDGDWQPSLPTVGLRADGVGLFYPGKCHTVASESEGGKTWFALSACLIEMQRGNHALYIDFEDDEGSTINRLLMMGAKRDEIRNHFTYLRPDAALGSGLHRDDLAVVLRDTDPTITILDGITEALALHGFDANKNNEVAAFGQMLPTWIANHGPAVVSLDHVVKNGETRGRYAIGAVHKLNGLNGAAYVLENRHPFGIGQRGVSYVKLSKDRPGQLRRHAVASAGGLHWFADLVVDATGKAGAEAWTEVVAPQPSDSVFRPTAIMAEIMALIAKNGPLSKRMIRAGVKGKNETKDAALDQLILDGFLGEKTPHKMLKEWAEQ